MADDRQLYPMYRYGTVFPRLIHATGKPFLELYNTADSGLEDMAFSRFSIQGIHRSDSADTQEKWAFNGGNVRFILKEDDDNSIEIVLEEGSEDGRDTFVLYGDTPEQTVAQLIAKLQRLFQQEMRRQLKSEKKQRGRNLAAFRQTLGNRRPAGPRNSRTNGLAETMGPGATIASFLSGKTGTQKEQARKLKRQSVRGPAAHSGGQRTRRRPLRR